MILVDYRNIALAAAYVELKGGVPLTGHYIVNTLRLLNKRFKDKYGSMVLCNDSGSWRYAVFDHYKAKRRFGTKDEGYKVKIELLDDLFDALDVHSNWLCMRVENTEADDIMAYLSGNIQERGDNRGLDLGGGPRNLIVSADKDMGQMILQGIDVYNPIKKKMVQYTEDDLYELIFRGDSIDGIPNILSPDDVFMVEGSRQRPLLKSYIETIKAAKTIEEGIDALNVKGLDNDTIKRNFKRNHRLIHFGHIPTSTREAIHNEFDKKLDDEKVVDLLGIFSAYKVKNMLPHMADFT